MTDRAPGLPTIDVNEYGGKDKTGERQAMNRRLFMQLVVLDAPTSHLDAQVAHPHEIAEALLERLRSAKLPGVVYADVNDPRGLALLCWGEDPARFVRDVRPIFAHGRIARASTRAGWSMLGRTYSLGYEPDLEDALIHRSIRNVMASDCPWHIWYPLRRKGEFNRIDGSEQSAMMREHGAIGHAYGNQGLGHDVRLACHGLDGDDNDFVIGLVGKELHPLSHLVQSMRKTRQTSEFMEKMGPFFVGHVLHRNEGPLV
jgi:Chlorite dismutase